jgi:hypothetical protein
VNAVVNATEMSPVNTLTNHVVQASALPDPTNTRAHIPNFKRNEGSLLMQCATKFPNIPVTRKHPYIFQSDGWH